jgi:Cytochrome oxidase complex assembly protein 1
VSTQPAFPTGLMPPAPPKWWMARNWKWFVPTLCVLGLLMIVGFVGGIFTLVHTLMVHSDPYQVAMDRAEHSAQVESEIGLQLHVGWLITGQLNESGTHGTANMQVPISGPHGKGEIIIEAEREGGKWTYQTLEVEVIGKSDTIPLLRANEKAAPKGSDSQI